MAIMNFGRCSLNTCWAMAGLTGSMLATSYLWQLYCGQLWLGLGCECYIWPQPEKQ